MNNTERAQWIDNDEGLYNMWRSSGLSKHAFIKANRAEIDAVTNNVRTGAKPAHYLTYHHGAGCPCAYCKGVPR